MAYIPEKEKFLCYHYIEERKTERNKARLAEKKLPAAPSAAAARAAAARGAAGSFQSGKFFYLGQFFAAKSGAASFFVGQILPRNGGGKKRIQ